MDPVRVFALWDRLMGWKWVRDQLVLDAMFVLDRPRLEKEAEQAESMKALSKVK